MSNNEMCRDCGAGNVIPSPYKGPCKCSDCYSDYNRRCRNSKNNAKLQEYYDNITFRRIDNGLTRREIRRIKLNNIEKYNLESKILFDFSDGESEESEEEIEIKKRKDVPPKRNLVDIEVVDEILPRSEKIELLQLKEEMMDMMKQNREDRKQLLTIIANLNSKFLETVEEVKTLKNEVDYLKSKNLRSPTRTLLMHRH